MEKQIISKLLTWYAKFKRDLPWRVLQENKLPNPYYVFVSEYMLQQTTVPTVKTRFEEFIQKSNADFTKKVDDLVAVKEVDIMKV